MSEDLYAKLDHTKKVRFQTGEKEDGNAGIGQKIDDVVIYDNYQAEGGTLPKSQDRTVEDQQQDTSVKPSPKKRYPLKAAVALMGLLCLLLLAAVTVLLFLLIHDRSSWNTERTQFGLDIANLTGERDKLQLSYSEMKNLSHNLSQWTKQLQEERDFLNAVNSNITNERNELQKQIETQRCPDSWIQFGKSCYLISTAKKNWADSREECEKTNDSQLVIISSYEEQEFINLFDLRTWIGLSDEETEGTWTWVDGTPLETAYWGKRQPDNLGPNNTPENCAEIVKWIERPPNTKYHDWNDYQCSSLSRFICEKKLW